MADVDGEARRGDVDRRVCWGGKVKRAELNWQNATKHLGNCVTNTHNLILTFLNRYQLQHSTTSTLYKANFDT